MTELGEQQPSNGRKEKPPKRNWEAARREHFFDLKFSHYVELILTAILVGIGYLQYTVYTRQAGIMDTQTRILKIDKRPWIKNTVTLAGPIRFADWAGQKSVFVSLLFNLKNYGDSPAVNIRVGAEIMRHPGNAHHSDLDAPQERVCKGVRRDADENPIGGFAVFSSDSAPIEQGNGTGIVYQTDESILFAVVGCVVYTFAETERGETGFRMMLGRVGGKLLVVLPYIKGPPQPYEEPISPELRAQGYPAKPPNVGLLQPGDVVFRPEEGGNYAK